MNRPKERFSRLTIGKTLAEKVMIREGTRMLVGRQYIKNTKDVGTIFFVEIAGLTILGTTSVQLALQCFNQ